MNVVKLDIKTNEDLKLILDLAKRIDADILEISQTKEFNSPVTWLEKISQIGNISFIEDPTEWQRQIRKDKIITSRD